MIGKLITISALIVAPISISLSSVFAQPFQHKFGELREYHRHWLSVCPNEKDDASPSFYKRTCWASTYSGDEKGRVTSDLPGYSLSVQKDRFTGRFNIRFVAKTQTNYRTGAPVTFRFSDGTTVPLEFGKDVITNGNTINEFILADTDKAYDMISRMRYASHMIITMPGVTEPHRIQFSMMGLRKAMAFISINGRGDNNR